MVDPQPSLFLQERSGTNGGPYRLCVLGSVIVAASTGHQIPVDDGRVIMTNEFAASVLDDFSIIRVADHSLPIDHASRSQHAHPVAPTAHNEACGKCVSDQRNGCFGLRKGIVRGSRENADGVKCSYIGNIFYQAIQ